MVPLITVNVTSRTRLVAKGSSNLASPGKAAGMALEWVLLSRYLGKKDSIGMGIWVSRIGLSIWEKAVSPA